MSSRQTELLERGSAVFLDERGKGPTREAVLVHVVNTADLAALRFPYMGQLRELTLEGCVTALRCAPTEELAAAAESLQVKLPVGRLPTQRLNNRRQKGASEAAQQRGAEPTGSDQLAIPQRSVFVNREKRTIIAGVAAAAAEPQDTFQTGRGAEAQVCQIF